MKLLISISISFSCLALTSFSTVTSTWSFACKTTGIDGIDGIADSSNEDVASQFVTLDGKVSTTPVKGLNIVKSVNKNGQITTKKVVY